MFHHVIQPFPLIAILFLGERLAVPQNQARNSTILALDDVAYLVSFGIHKMHAIPQMARPVMENIQFAVNPDGVKRDFAMSNDGNEDGSWNGVWDVATAVDSLGWVAEYRIPLSQLRYAPAPSHTFGFGVWRDIERFRERSSWPLWSPQRPGISSQLGRLTGLQGITSDRRLEVTPYVVTKNVQRSMPQSRYEREQQLSIGGDNFHR